MSNLVGIKWGMLSKETQEWLLEGANCIDGRDCGNVKEGKCIVDLTEELSVSGEIIDDEIVIDYDAIIYNPIGGVVLEAKDANFILNEVMIVNEAAEMWGITEGAIRAAIKARRLVLGVDFRKAGRITLITKEAMKNLYGEEEFVMNKNLLEKIREDLEEITSSCIDENGNNLEIEWDGGSDGHYYFVNSEFLSEEEFINLRSKLDKVSEKVIEAIKRKLINKEEDLWN